MAGIGLSGHTLSDLILTKLQVPITEGKAQSGEVNCLRSFASEEQSWNSNLGI